MKNNDHVILSNEFLRSTIFANKVSLHLDLIKIEMEFPMDELCFLAADRVNQLVELASSSEEEAIAENLAKTVNRYITSAIEKLNNSFINMDDIIIN